MCQFLTAVVSNLSVKNSTAGMRVSHRPKRKKKEIKDLSQSGSMTDQSQAQIYNLLVLGHWASLVVNPVQSGMTDFWIDASPSLGVVRTGVACVRHRKVVRDKIYSSADKSLTGIKRWKASVLTYWTALFCPATPPLLSIDNYNCPFPISQSSACKYSNGAYSCAPQNPDF